MQPCPASHVTRALDMIGHLICKKQMIYYHQSEHPFLVPIHLLAVVRRTSSRSKPPRERLRPTSRDASARRVSSILLPTTRSFLCSGACKIARSARLDEHRRPSNNSLGTPAGDRSRRLSWLTNVLRQALGLAVWGIHQAAAAAQRSSSSSTQLAWNNRKEL